MGSEMCIRDRDRIRVGVRDDHGFRSVHRDPGDLRVHRELVAQLHGDDRLSFRRLDDHVDIVVPARHRLIEERSSIFVNISEPEMNAVPSTTASTVRASRSL